VVSLTTSAPDRKIFETSGVELLHLAIDDFTPPAPEQILAFIDFTDRIIASGGAVTVHCGAGMGRTGAMLACYLVHLGEAPAEAVESIRRIRPGSIETAGQEQCVFAFAGDCR